MREKSGTEAALALTDSRYSCPLLQCLQLKSTVSTQKRGQKGKVEFGDNFSLQSLVKSPGITIVRGKDFTLSVTRSINFASQPFLPHLFLGEGSLGLSRREGWWIMSVPQGRTKNNH